MSANTVKGMMSLNQFKTFLGIEKLQFLKGKGREYCGTPVGTVFMAKDFDAAKPGFITVAGTGLKTASGEDLEGTIWLVNSAVQLGREI